MLVFLLYMIVPIIPDASYNINFLSVGILTTFSLGMMEAFSMLILASFLVVIQSHFHHQWSFAKKWLKLWVEPKGILWLNSTLWCLCTISGLLNRIPLDVGNGIHTNIMQIFDFFHSFCSQYYTRFKSYCCEAYNIIRKSSNLILNLFHLMAGSNIPDIASDPEKGILKVTSFMIVILFMFLSL